MKNKKGLSAVVTTLMIILLVFVAIAIVWVVIRNVVERGAGSITTGADCLEIDLSITHAECNSSQCDVIVERGTGGDSIDGFKVIIKDNDGNSVSEDFPGSLGVFDTSAESVDLAGLTLTTYEDIKSVEVAAYLKNAQGEIAYCSTSPTFGDITQIPLTP